MPELTIAELTLLLCLTCLALAGGLIWACYEVAPRLAVARRAPSRHDRWAAM